MEEVISTMKKITIIIPTYKRLSYLKIAVESCLQQSLLPERIIIGDDSPDDETENWVGNFSPLKDVIIEYYHNRPSLKQANNVEFLIQKVETELLLLLHDDDFLLPVALESLYQVFDEQVGIDVAFGKQYIVSANGEIDYKASEELNLAFFRNPSYHLQELLPLDVALRQQLPSNSFLMKTEMAKSVHYNFEEEARDAVDFLFCLNLAKAGVKFMFTDIHVSGYRITSDSINSVGNPGYYSYKLVNELEVVGETLTEQKRDFLITKAPVAILQALNMKLKKEAWTIYFSEHHRGRIFSLGGIKRGLKLITRF